MVRWMELGVGRTLMSRRGVYDEVMIGDEDFAALYMDSTFE